MRENASSVLDDYLSATEPSHRRALRTLHDVIASAVPTAELVVRRGVPSFRHRGRPLVSIGDAKHHVSLYVMQGQALDVHSKELAGYDSSRTVVRFDPGSTIPEDLVVRLVRTRVAEIDARGS